MGLWLFWMYTLSRLPNRNCAIMPSFLQATFFQLIAVENLGSFDLSSLEFLNDHGNKICLSSGKDKERTFLFQHISVVTQRYNCAFARLFLSRTVWTNSLSSFAFSFLFLTLGIYTTEGKQKQNNMQLAYQSGNVRAIPVSLGRHG